MLPYNKEYCTAARDAAEPMKIRRVCNHGKRIKLTQESLDAYKDELEYLKTTRADEVAEQLKEARSFGDLSENAEYDEAKNEQGKLYSASRSWRKSSSWRLS